MPKLTVLTLATFLLSLNIGLSQRVALVDVNEILENLDDYQAAQNEIDKISAQWRQEIAQEYDNIKSMYNKYQAEQVLLSDEVRKEREDEIMEKEKEVREMQKRKFGPEGDLFRRRQEIVSPIQDQVYAAIEEYAKDKGYDIVLDRSSAAGLLYTNDEYNKTAEIRRILGISN